MPRQSHHISKAHRDNGFTLVELLVSITILVILATVTLYGMASVQKMAMVQRAKSQIARIHELIMERWESYETRNVVTKDINTNNFGFLPTGVMAPLPEDMRLLAIRELMRFELPDRITDVYPPTATSTPLDERAVLAQLPPLARYYRRRTPPPGPDPDVNWTFVNESAECLYLIISRITIGDISALELFSEDEIGDTDGDNMPEIIDPWGHPITFIRWPVGYSVAGNVTLNEIPDPTEPHLSSDPFDLSGRETLTVTDASGNAPNPPYNANRVPPHAVFPLIISAGPDGIRSILSEFEGLPPTAPMTERVRYSQRTVTRREPGEAMPVTRYWPNDPFEWFVDDDGPPGFWMGTINPVNPQAAADNITNHLISTGIK